MRKIPKSHLIFVVGFVLIAIASLVVSIDTLVNNKVKIVQENIEFSNFDSIKLTDLQTDGRLISKTNSNYNDIVTRNGISARHINITDELQLNNEPISADMLSRMKNYSNWFQISLLPDRTLTSTLTTTDNTKIGLFPFGQVLSSTNMYVTGAHEYLKIVLDDNNATFAKIDKGQRWLVSAQINWTHDSHIIPTNFCCSLSAKTTSEPRISLGYVFGKLMSPDVNYTSIPTCVINKDESPLYIGINLKFRYADYFVNHAPLVHIHDLHLTCVRLPDD